MVLRVSDSGPGIPGEKRAQVFDRFYRVLGTETAGTGLGLSIVKRVAELHQAEIRLEDSPHGGLEVRVRFACQAPVLEETPPQ